MQLQWLKSSEMKKRVGYKIPTILSTVIKILLACLLYKFGLFATTTIITIALFVLTQDLFQFTLCFVAYLTFMQLLPKVFVTYKHSFSYGEGCLVLQSLVLFCIKSTLRLLEFIECKGFSVFMTASTANTVHGWTKSSWKKKQSFGFSQILKRFHCFSSY